MRSRDFIETIGPLMLAIVSANEKIQKIHGNGPETDSTLDAVSGALDAAAHLIHLAVCQCEDREFTQ